MHAPKLSATTLALMAAMATSVLSGQAEAKDWQSVTIALEGAYEPWNLTNPDGSLGGFEPELAANLCARMKVKCKLIAQDWDGMIAGLKVGKFDVIMDGLAVTEERKKEIAFSVPYASTPAVFAALKNGRSANLSGTGKEISLTGRAATDKPAMDLLRKELKGKTIGIQTGTAFAPFIYTNFKEVASIREYKTAAEHDMDLQAGRIDVAFDDATYFVSAFARPDNKTLAFTGPKIGGPIWGVGEALGFRQADTDLKARFDVAIKAALADGTVKKLSEKWFKLNIAPKQ
ncbi:transporter substrate-binding domain-containing protein [Vogesella sp. LIG4]|uniref:transporter substrate-binding domain-containing protein n=1 Tax=Vogesella sp. LIG4 TaxID=1192162 RepID=UPI00081FEDEA|nr:transporter substrate-binding domain-containing protein [Vogesella sp. LIG4]SCK15699.1 octopine/nopaline transport system substrate-binding protein [Vogesella sp. LIG4]